MNYLITGANGFLGKILFKELIRDNKIFCLSRSYSDYAISLEKEIPIFSHSFDIVIHAAGKAHCVPKNEFENQQFHQVNVVGTQNLLKGLESFKLPKHFVFISSVSVYGLDTGRNINENYPLNAKDPYGISKIEGEQIVLDWCKENNILCTILRLPLIVGENPSGNLKLMINGIRRGYYFNIAGGSANKSMILAQDVAKFIANTNGVGGIYNLTDGYHPTFNELSHLIAKQFGRKSVPNMPASISKILAIIGDIFGSKFPINSSKLRKITSELTFDDSKARNKFDWKPTSVLEGFKLNVINI
jgi:nucleoside-diphosphate-sugar epimerase